MNNNISSERSNSKRKKLCSARAEKPFKTIRSLRSKHPKNVFLGNLNISSLRNKFESVNEVIKDTFDIFWLSESKLDSSFPDRQFSIPGYRIIRKDRNKNGVRILFYISPFGPSNPLWGLEHRPIFEQQYLDNGKSKHCVHKKKYLKSI